jgi:hypothetical protein
MALVAAAVFGRGVKRTNGYREREEAGGGSSVCGLRGVGMRVMGGETC